MRILVVSQYYPPENTHIVPALVHRLADKGHEVRVLTGYPNYPSGRVFDGYVQRWRQYEADGAVRVCRVPLFANHSQSPLPRMLNYLSFGLSASTARRFAREADVIYVYATQMTAALGPWLWRLTRGAPYVLHVQDLWPDSIVGSSLLRAGLPSRLVAALLNPWIASVYRHAAAVIGIAPTMTETLIRRGVDRRRTRLVYNWADEKPAQSPSSAVIPHDSAETRLLYAGNVGDLQDLENVVKAVHNAKDAGIQLTVLGGGVALPRIRALVQELGATNIQFREPVPGSAMPDVYGATDFALVTLKDLPVFAGTIPSKFQAALANGVPVISTVQGDLRTLVETLGVGFAADAEAPASLEAALRAAARLSQDDRDTMAARALQTYSDRFSLAAGANAVELVLAEAASGEPRNSVQQR